MTIAITPSGIMKKFIKNNRLRSYFSKTRGTHHLRHSGNRVSDYPESSETS
ncbi:MAG: hypothetical protein ACD_70C00206G0001 [uncultured bacterium]|nr:MAG: hypothetical protein ACD_70C00206G0001 [uncultured bacterium]